MAIQERIKFEIVVSFCCYVALASRCRLQLWIPVQVCTVFVAGIGRYNITHICVLSVHIYICVFILIEKCIVICLFHRHKLTRMLFVHVCLSAYMQSGIYVLINKYINAPSNVDTYTQPFFAKTP